MATGTEIAHCPLFVPAELIRRFRELEREVAELRARANIEFLPPFHVDSIPSHSTAVSIDCAEVAFKTIAVDGQDDVVADAPDDTLTLAEGSGIEITTDADTDTITIAATGGGSTDSFKTIAVSGQSDVVADSATDTLTLVEGANIDITTDASTDTITIAAANAITSLNGWTGPALLFVLGKEGDGPNLYNDVAAWSSSVEYQVGDIVVRLGVYYNCVFKHTNQTPPNVTYWSVVGSISNVIVLNIPDAVYDGRGLINAATQFFGGDKYFYGSVRTQIYSTDPFAMMYADRIYAEELAITPRGVTTSGYTTRIGQAIAPTLMSFANTNVGSPYYGSNVGMSILVPSGAGTNRSHDFQVTVLARGNAAVSDGLIDGCLILNTTDYENSDLADGQYYKPVFAINTAYRTSDSNWTTVSWAGVWAIGGAAIAGLEFAGGLFVGGSFTGVTSVAVSGGTTGLTTSGGPITGSGTITLDGTLGVANGGTGATSLTSGSLIVGAGTGALSAVATTRVSGGNLQLKLASDSWIEFGEASF